MPHFKFKKSLHALQLPPSYGTVLQNQHSLQNSFSTALYARVQHTFRFQRNHRAHSLSKQAVPIVQLPENDGTLAGRSSLGTRRAFCITSHITLLYLVLWTPLVSIIVLYHLAPALKRLCHIQSCRTFHARERSPTHRAPDAQATNNRSMLHTVPIISPQFCYSNSNDNRKQR